MNELILAEISDTQAQEAFVRDPMDPQPQQPPTIESIIERANELTALYQKVDEVN